MPISAIVVLHSRKQLSKPGFRFKKGPVPSLRLSVLHLYEFGFFLRSLRLRKNDESISDMPQFVPYRCHVSDIFRDSISKPKTEKNHKQKRSSFIQGIQLLRWKSDIGDVLESCISFCNSVYLNRISLGE